MTLAHRYKILVNSCWVFAFLNLGIAGLVLYRVTHKYTYTFNVHPPQQIVITNFTSSVSSNLSSSPVNTDRFSTRSVLVRTPLNYGFCVIDGASAISFNGRIYYVGDYLLGHVIVSLSRSVIICDDCIYYFDNTPHERELSNGNINI